VAAGNEMRVSDAEREAAAAELQEHFASGRLNQDELNERLSTAFAAKTRGDLKAIFADLPSSGHGWSDESAPSGRTSAAGGPFGPFGTSGTFGHDSSAGWQDHGARRPFGGGIGRLVFTSIMVWALLIFGILGIFGIGTGRPFGVVLIIAAFALLRRLLFIFFGRRRSHRGPRRRR
jgi:Domain of unknown function (DUF1707)